MTTERRRPKGVFRRLERWMVGLVMAVFAFALERAVVRSIRKEGGDPMKRDTSSTVTTKGTDADLDKA